VTSYAVGALVLIAGLIAAILVTRSVSKDSKNTARSARAKGIRFFFTWFFVGGTVAFVTFMVLMFAAMGGAWMPPGPWLSFHALGILVLPILLTFGGVPAAIRIAQGKAWKKTARVSLAVCVISWTVILGIVLLGPSIFGWSW
jgi:uncharacterized protein with PQ loop repeat